MDSKRALFFIKEQKYQDYIFNKMMTEEEYGILLLRIAGFQFIYLNLHH